MERLNLSAPSYERSLKVARTNANLRNESDSVPIPG